ENREVEYRVLERDRDQVRGLELQRARELGARHHRHLDLTNDDTRARDTDAYRDLSFESDLGTQTPDCLADFGALADLALAHRFARQCELSEQAEARRCARRDLSDRDGVRADVEANQAAGHASPPPWCVTEMLWTSR